MEQRPSSPGRAGGDGCSQWGHFARPRRYPPHHKRCNLIDFGSRWRNNRTFLYGNPHHTRKQTTYNGHDFPRATSHILGPDSETIYDRVGAGQSPVDFPVLTCHTTAMTETNSQSQAMLQPGQAAGMTTTFYEIASDGMPSLDDRDDRGWCWWGWAHSPGHGNPWFWRASWAYSEGPRGATHWAPYWAFPVVPG